MQSVTHTFLILRSLYSHMLEYPGHPKIRVIDRICTLLGNESCLNWAYNTPVIQILVVYPQCVNRVLV
jgi:hypothetical protein